MLGSFHGTLAVVVFCLLLFAEEAGVPIPFLPGDLLLLAAGLLMANGDMSPFVFLPAAVTVAIAGAMVGYSWARLLGMTGVRALAERLRAAHHLQRASERVQLAGPLGIALWRLCPGMRINTTLLAGALGVRRRTFLLGIAPTVAVWVPAFTLMGAVAGGPVERAIRHVNHLAIQGALLMAIGLAAYLTARHIPALGNSDGSVSASPGWQKISFAAMVDVAAIASLVIGVDALTHLFFHLREPDGWNDVVVVIAVTAIAYVLTIRRSVGLTAGETLLRVSYRARRDTRDRDTRDTAA
jgi:membrane-associated protein